jgi:hypothetical protein
VSSASAVNIFATTETPAVTPALRRDFGDFAIGGIIVYWST